MRALNVYKQEAEGFRVVRVCSYIVAFLLLFAASTSVQASAVYKSIHAFKLAHKNLVAMNVISSDTDINGDGLKDWLGVFYNKSTIQIFVLFGVKGGGYIISGSSVPSEFGGYAIGDGWISELKAYSKNSFYLAFGLKNGYSAFSTHKYKFKLVNDVWRLIGYDFEYTPLSNQSDGYSVSINYLTGQFIKNSKNHKSVKGKKTYPLYRLRDFNFNNSYGMDKFWK